MTHVPELKKFKKDVKYVIHMRTNTGIGIRDLPQKIHNKGKIQAIATTLGSFWDHFWVFPLTSFPIGLLFSPNRNANFCLFF